MSIAEQVATSPTYRVEDKELTQYLLVAYRHSSEKLLVDRQDRKAQLRGLQSQLQKTMTTLETRCTAAEDVIAYQEAHLAANSTVSVRLQRDVQETIPDQKDNIWLDTIVNGEAGQNQIDFLEADFDDIWGSHLSRKQPYVNSKRCSTLLESLQHKVTAQRYRVQQLHAFQNDLNGRNEGAVDMLQSPVRKTPRKTPMKDKRKLNITPRPPGEFRQILNVPRMALTAQALIAYDQ